MAKKKPKTRPVDLSQSEFVAWSVWCWVERAKGFTEAFPSLPFAEIYPEEGGLSYDPGVPYILLVWDAGEDRCDGCVLFFRGHFAEIIMRPPLHVLHSKRFTYAASDFDPKQIVQWLRENAGLSGRWAAPRKLPEPQKPSV